MRMFRYEVPLDDQWHEIELSGAGARLQDCHVGIAPKHGDAHRAVSFWAENWPSASPQTYWFRVYGTGHQVPSIARYVGTAVDPPFVWHLFAREE